MNIDLLILALVAIAYCGLQEYEIRTLKKKVDHLETNKIRQEYLIQDIVAIDPEIKAGLKRRGYTLPEPLGVPRED